MILSSLLERRDRASYIADWLAGIGDYLTTYTGENISQASALTLSAVYRCVTILMDDVGRLPTHCFRIKGEDREIDRDHPTTRILSIAANEAMTPIAYTQLMEMRRELWGNAYAHVQTDYNGMVEELIPLPPEYVVPYIDEDGALWYTVNLPGMEPRKLPNYDVVHVRGFSTDGISGNSILGYARETIGVGQAEQKFEGRIYSQGMKLGGVIETPSKLGPDEKDVVRREFERMTSGLSNMHRVAVLNVGEKFTAMDMPLKDAQFVESRQFNIAEIARFWGMPLYKLQEGKQAYSSNEQQALDYLANPLDAILVQYEQEYRRKLLSPGEQKKRYFRFNRAALLRTDVTARGAFLKTMVEAGIYTRNEARAYEELNAYRGNDNPADRLFVSKNYASIENIDKAVGAAPAPAEGPARAQEVV